MIFVCMPVILPDYVCLFTGVLHSRHSGSGNGATRSTRSVGACNTPLTPYRQTLYMGPKLSSTFNIWMSITSEVSSCIRRLALYRTGWNSATNTIAVNIFCSTFHVICNCVATAICVDRVWYTAGAADGGLWAPAALSGALRRYTSLREGGKLVRLYVFASVCLCACVSLRVTFTYFRRMIPDLMWLLFFPILFCFMQGAWDVQNYRLH